MEPEKSLNVEAIAEVLDEQPSSGDSTAVETLLADAVNVSEGNTSSDVAVEAVVDALEQGETIEVEDIAEAIV